MLEALSRPPCVVSFSGGRDSSSVLALATHLARRHGLPEPIPVSLQFPAHPRDREPRWQELVVEHLGLDDWRPIELGEEVGALGSVTRDVLERHGVLWPPTLYAFVPGLRHAGGGTFLTGIGGDDFFEGWKWARVDRILHGEVRPAPADVKHLVARAAPRPARAAWALARSRRLPWLTPRAARRVIARVIAQDGFAPAGWSAFVRWRQRIRPFRLGQASLGILAESLGATSVNPFIDPRFLLALAEEPRQPGRGDRRTTMTRLFPGLLPEAVLARTEKGTALVEAFWGAETAALAEAIPDEALPPSLVRRAELRAEWSRGNIDATLPLQAAWLASRGRRGVWEIG